MSGCFDYCFATLRNLDCKGRTHAKVREVVAATVDATIAIDSPHGVGVVTIRRTNPVGAII